MIFTVGVGLAVDDTIHLLTRFSQERRRRPHASMRDSLLESLRTSGAALAVTSAVLGLGALCYLPSTFQSLRDVGVLMTAIVSSAFLADVFVLPLLLERFCAKTVVDSSGS